MSSSFFKVTVVEQTGSTNSDVVKLAQAGEPEGYVLQALEQTAGKGRRGRGWESPRGNLYVSLLLRPRCQPKEACYYSFVAAMAVYDTVAAIRGDADLQLKWPNDVLIDGKKMCGILIDAAPVEQGGIDWLVVGVGINIAHHPSAALYPATSLAQEGCATTPDKVLPVFLKAFDQWRTTLLRDGFSPIRRAWLSDAKRGAISVKLPTGEVEGTFGGMDAEGGLILRLADGTERVIQAGDVFFA